MAMRYDLNQIHEILMEKNVRNSKGKPFSVASVRKILDEYECHYEERLDAKGRKQKVKTYSEMTLIEAFMGNTIFDGLNNPIQEILIEVRKAVSKFDALQAKVNRLEAENSELKGRLSRLKNTASDLVVKHDLNAGHLKLVEKPEYVH